MARLTDQELNVIQESRVSFLFGVVEAKTRPAAPAPSQAPKPVTLGLVATLMFRPITDAIKRRRTAAELKRLPAHMLADIGIIPGDIDRVIARAAADKRAPAAGPQTVGEAFSLWRQQRTAVRELESLDDRALMDIGVARSEIPQVVSKALARAA
ncbi:MAG: DUF1127 domain-containing protein [Pseudomonadota bacterium]